MVIPFGLLAIGGLFVYSGMTGRSVIDVLRGLPSDIAKPSVWNMAVAYNAVNAQAQGGGGGDSSGISAGRVDGYANPFPSKYWSIGRTDQGVDFAPKANGAPILAIGDGVVKKIGAPGWPGGGGGVLYQLTSGAQQGKYIFVYESLSPTVHVGQRVKAGQVIAHGRTGGTGIEIGFADASGVPLAHAGYTEGKVTGWGTRMKQFLANLEHPSKPRTVPGHRRP